ncbi:MAG: arginine N-succinyltransferase [Planctomycetota bacterium]|nr:MAG: arginine N-succinyltransferase [Planctomycetota bacterium]
MEIVRSVRLEDLDALWDLIRQATYGLTTLQITREQLSERLELSNFAFSRRTEKPSGEPYIFVMEDLTTGRLVGTSGVFSKTGGYEPFYSYRRVVEENYCELLDKRQVVESLHLQKIHDGPTEIGSLFLAPEYRGKGRGRLLSLSRFTFMAAHPKRFADEVIAEMRGVMDRDGNCPFYEAIGRHFFDMDFPQADSLSTLNKKFIEDLMPKYPIYTALLPQSARDVMGQVHEQTQPALAMLEAEGFRKIDMIDIFDGGPVVQCRREQIGAVRRTLAVAVRHIVDAVEPPPYIVASDQGFFRAMLAPIHVDAGTGEATIDRVTAATLRVKTGDPVLVTALHPDQDPAGARHSAVR